MTRTDMWKRVVLAVLTAVSVTVVAGCGDSAADKQAKTAQAAQEVKASVKKAEKDREALVSDAQFMQTLFRELAERDELKGKELKIFQSLNIDVLRGYILIDLQKPGTTDKVVRYTYEFDEKKWQDPQPVELRGNTEDLASNFYAFEMIRPEVLGRIIETGNAAVQEKNPKSFGGTVANLAQSLRIRDGSVFWYTRYSNSENYNEPTIRIYFDDDGNMTKYGE